MQSASSQSQDEIHLYHDSPQTTEALGSTDRSIMDTKNPLDLRQDSSHLVHHHHLCLESRHTFLDPLSPFSRIHLHTFPFRLHRLIKPLTVRNIDMFSYILHQPIRARCAFENTNSANAWDVQGGGETGLAAWWYGYEAGGC